MPRPRPTLLPPPPHDPACCALENDLHVTALGVLGEDIFTNTRPTWHPAGARGIFGGSVVALSVAAAQRTVGQGAPQPDGAPGADAAWALHSAHCYFLLAGNGDLPIVFHVERIQDGRSYAARTVQARQRGRVIFTVTLSFVRRADAHARGGLPTLTKNAGPTHAAVLPADAPPMPAHGYGDNGHETIDEAVHARLARAMKAAGVDGDVHDNNSDSDDGGLFRLPVQGGPMVLARPLDEPPATQRSMQWVRVRGQVSEAGGAAAHIAALAFLSDRFFIGTVARIHRLWSYPVPAEDLLLPGADSAKDDDGGPVDRELRAATRAFAEFATGGVPLEKYLGRPTIGMIVSRDHVLYIHAADRVRVDDWMLVEMASPWAGEGRGVVSQRIYSRDGTLVASCVQEGLVRVKEEGAAKL